MTKLELYSEPFARTGNIAGEGSKRLLGSPTLGMLPTVIREALQNSLDASVGIGQPRVLLRVRSLGADELQTLRMQVVSSLPATQSDSCRIIADSLAQEKLTVFEICDYGTSGLGGPVRADLPVQEGDEPDFVNFIRNVGAARDTHHGGGTYGYGKTSLYAMSKCATILVDTETSHHDEAVRRLIGCHLGAAYDATGFDDAGLRYTGRHWWGVSDDCDGVDPLEGGSAASLSQALGLPDRGHGQTGTSIMIIDPDFGKPDQIEHELIEAVLWNFWPRMTESTPANRRLTVDIEVDGKPVALPKPENFPPLDLFSAAISDIRKRGSESTTIRCGNPSKDLGKLAIQRGIAASRHPAAYRKGSCIPMQCSLIALMRPVELVVKYLPGEAFADASFEWGGVFICSGDEEVEDAFAAAEPPAHDDWVFNNMASGRAKTFVKVGLRELKRIAGEYAIPRGVRDTCGQEGPSLAQTASLLGKHLMQSSSQGPGRSNGSSGGKSGRSVGSRGNRNRLGVSKPIFVKLDVDEEGGLISHFSATLRNTGDDPHLLVRAEPYLVADGGSTTLEDLGGDFIPVVRDIRLLNSDAIQDGDSLAVGTEDGKIEITVTMPSEAAIGLRLCTESSAMS